MSTTSKLRFHMIGHAHLDPVWLWRWQEGFEEIRATFRSALERMKETKDFCFTASSILYYVWIKECEPEMFEEIKKRVAEGRWEIAGGWWIEADCNIPHGESFVRQGLYSQKFVEKEFGKKVTVGFNPDSFGHAGTLPQIMKKMGINAYAYSRPNVNEYKYPEGNSTTFWWQAPDGSRVLTSLIPVHYEDRGNIESSIETIRKWQHFLTGQKEILSFYGVSNHGGGPTKRTIAKILELQKDGSMPELVFSTLERYFRAMQENLPEQPIRTVEGDLQHHARGCYSVHSEVKRLTRKCEHALMTAERFSAAVSQAFGIKYPYEKLYRAWTNLLFNQFHDILGGTCVKEAYEDVRDSFGEVKQIASELLNSSVTEIARRVDTTGSGNCVVVFNPLPWLVRTAIEVSPHVRTNLSAPLRFVDDKGKPVPSQEIFYGHIGSHAHTFFAEVPAMGYRLYRALSAESVPEPKVTGVLDADEKHLENDYWLIEIDPKSGDIVRLYDKVHKVEVLDRGAVLSVLSDSSDTWSHNVVGYRVEDGRFGNARIQVFEFGEVKATLRITSTFGKSTIEHYVTLYRMSNKIDGRLEINWQESYRCLKFTFDTKIKNAQIFCETPYGFTERSLNGEEQPCQSWIDLSGKAAGGIDYGLALLNDCKYGYDAQCSQMRLTLLRSPAY
ncbi:MAG: glycoside hydrolase family 38 C-terminal domain-containing protein, partial [Planctomycetota bacterium]